MNFVLVRKLFRDLRINLLVVCLLLGLFFFLWCKITQQSTQLMRELSRDINIEVAKAIFFNTDSGKFAQTLMGGERIDVGRPLDAFSVGFMHPLVQTILCIWAIGRAAGAIAGEIDKGTMELLLAQPIRRFQVILSHLAIDVLTIPLLCCSMWAGIWVGSLTFGLLDLSHSDPLKIDPKTFGPALLNVAALLFAVSGQTIFISSLGRFRMRILGIAVLFNLLQFLANLIGQLWKLVQWVRPVTLFFYYQPQPVILGTAMPDHLLLGKIEPVPLLAFNVTVLVTVGLAGYGLALWTFCRRDLPAPL